MNIQRKQPLEWVNVGVLLVEKVWKNVTEEKTNSVVLRWCLKFLDWNVTTSVCAVYVQLVCWEEFSITMNEIRGYMFYKRKLTIKSKKINNERAHFPCFLSCGQLKKLRERLGTAIMTIKKKE